jgi:hypothetical protein
LLSSIVNDEPSALSTAEVTIEADVPELLLYAEKPTVPACAPVAAASTTLAARTPVRVRAIGPSLSPDVARTIG